MSSRPLRVLIDTNIYISSLLKYDPTRPITQLMQAIARREFTLLVPEMLLVELAARVPSKPYLAARISAAELAELLYLLTMLGERILPATANPTIDLIGIKPNRA